MKILLSAFFFSLSIYCYAQPNLIWSEPINSNGNIALDMQSDENGNFYILTRDSIFKKEGDFGQTIWARQFDVTTASTPAEMKVEKDGTIYICGNSYINANQDIVVEKINTNGNLEWREYYNNTANVDDFAHSLDTDTLGNVFIGGKIKLSEYEYWFAPDNGTYYGGSEGLTYIDNKHQSIILKFDNGGSLINEYLKPFSILSDYGTNAINKIKVDNSGNVVVGGYDFTSYIDYNYFENEYFLLENCVDSFFTDYMYFYRFRQGFVSKLSNDLNLIWNKNIDPIMTSGFYDCGYNNEYVAFDDEVRDIVIDNNNNIYTASVILSDIVLNVEPGYHEYDPFFGLSPYYGYLWYQGIEYGIEYRKFNTSNGNNWSIENVSSGYSYNDRAYNFQTKLKYNSYKDEIHLLSKYKTSSTRWRNLHEAKNSTGSTTFTRNEDIMKEIGYSLSFNKDTTLIAYNHAWFTSNIDHFNYSIYDGLYNEFYSFADSWPMNGSDESRIIGSSIKSGSIHLLFDKTFYAGVHLNKYCLSYPTVNILNSDTLVCFGDSIQLNSNISNYDSYYWDNGTNLSDSLNQNPVYYSNVQSTLSLIAEKEGCFRKDEVNIDIAGISLNQPDLDTNMCYLDSIVLDVANYRIASYNWNVGDTTSSIIAKGDSLATYEVYTTDVCGFNDTVSFSIEPNYYCRKVCGNVYADLDSNCLADTNEFGLQNFIIRAKNGIHYASTNDEGYYNINLNENENEIELIIPSKFDDYFYQICPDSTHYVYVDSLLSDTCGLDFSIGGYDSCVKLSTSLAVSRLRRCEDAKYYILYENYGFDTSFNTILNVTIDTNFLVIGGEVPTSVAENTYTFNLGNVPPMSSERIEIDVNVKCSGFIGQTLCSKAEIYSDNNCIEQIPNGWDKSSIKVDGKCIDDSLLRLVIYNTGEFGNGDMQFVSEYRIYEDSLLAYSNNFQLVGGDSLVIHVLGNGSTIRLEADQHPNHPGFSHPNVVIAGCGLGDSLIIDYISQFYTDDEDINIDIHCSTIRGSYDPNAKEVFPSGITENHFVKPNRELEYTIHFQNTGNDTAFYVLLTDSLPNELDISTIQVGSSSHDFEYFVTGIGLPILNFEFNDIILPDSNIDLEGSQGFVNFKIKPKTSLINGTVINNNVDIFFDYNEPVRTNDAWITLFDTNIVGGIVHIVECDSNTLPNYILHNADTVLCLGQLLFVSSVGGDRFLWSPNINISDSSISNPVISTLEDRNYQIQVWDSSSCYSIIEELKIDIYDTIPQAEFSYQLTGFEVSLNDSSSNDVNSWYWSIGEDSLSNLTQANYEFTQDGVYDICLIASNDCFSDTLCKQITISGVGIEHKLGIGNIKVYPNPVTNQMSIELNDVDKEVTSIQLIDISGRVIEKSFQKAQSNIIVIDVSELQSGIYIYNILSNNEILGVGEIFKK